MSVLIVAVITFMVLSLGLPTLLGLARLLGLYAIVGERESHVFVLFGQILGVISEAGLHFLPSKLGMGAVLVRLFGRRVVLDLSLGQEYLRSQPVNSEEGAPMGIGIWYEMWVNDPVSFLFKNADPRTSLQANVSNAAVRTLSNMKLGDMLETRHAMSMLVRNEVSPKSHEWGFKLGSVYIRKVHFRDGQMVRQIQEKVVNRLRQVTSAIQQDGANQVSLIRGTAEREAAIEFAKATALRPKIVGEALRRIQNNPRVAAATFDVLETQRLLEGPAEITLLPQGDALASLVATGNR